MAHKAGIERIADQVTGHFVPFVVAASAITFVAWIVRGYSGGCPEEWLDSAGAKDGGWALFAVQFAVAVLVVVSVLFGSLVQSLTLHALQACPCGIGLAAPTAQMVGTGLAARLGIVNYGGGQSFQNATSINVVVFDKTGTITRGEFSVAHHHLSANILPPSTFFRALELVEDTSAHPISLGLRAFCQHQVSFPPQQQAATTESIHLVRSEEIPGRGLAAVVTVDLTSYEVIVGNELLLKERDSVDPSPENTASLIAEWGAEGNSIVLVAIRPLSSTEDDSTPFTLTSLFAVADTPRPEAAYLVQQLETKGIATYLCTGDNEVTAHAIARKVGISSDCVRAGVMPAGKAEFISALQRGGANDRLEQLRARRSWWKRGRRGTGRVKVLFVGDGINDVVALTQADVGVSMGTGAAVALSSSDFCLLSSNLLSLLTVLALSRATFRKSESSLLLFGGAIDWAPIFEAKESRADHRFFAHSSHQLLLGCMLQPRPHARRSRSVLRPRRDQATSRLGLPRHGTVLGVGRRQLLAPSLHLPHPEGCKGLQGVRRRARRWLRGERSYCSLLIDS